MALAVDAIHERGPINEMHCQLQPKVMLYHLSNIAAK